MPLCVRTRRALLTSVPALVLAAAPAHAHAVLEESQPADHGSVLAGPVALKLRFNSRIDRVRSRLTLTRPDRTKVTLPIEPDGPPDLVTATVVLTSGAYVVRWQVLAIDGHITRGDVVFSVMER